MTLNLTLVEESGLMLQCESCLSWSHCKCVNVLPQVAEKFPFICPLCIKSIFSLVPSLHSEISHLKTHINRLESCYKSTSSIHAELNAVQESLSSLSNKVTSIAQVCIPSIPDPIHQSPHTSVLVPSPKSHLNSNSCLPSIPNPILQSPHTSVPAPSPKSPLNPVLDPISSNSNSHLAISLANPVSYPTDSSSPNLSNPRSGHPQPKPPLLPLPTFPPSSQLPFYPIALAHPANPHYYNFLLLFLILCFLILPLIFLLLAHPTLPLCFLLLSPFTPLTLLLSNHSIPLHPPFTLHNILPTL